MSAGAARKRTLLDRLAAIEDGTIIRVAFYALLAGCAGMLYVDFRERDALDIPGLAGPLEPVLPAFDPDSPALAPGPSVTSDHEVLRQPLAVELMPGGVLTLTGTIDPGAAARVAAEVAERGEYVRTVHLDSPGGSVSDALEIGALLRDKGYATTVAAGAICASSCPLVFAGGTERHATPGSAIGVHQVYAALPAGELPSLAAASSAMSDAQKTTATVTRHLTAMGVDSSLWLHALETPPDRLYYFSSEELTGYRLVTHMEGAAP